MVRNLVGVLVECGTGWRDPDSVPAMLEARSRQAAGLGAPAMGLTLVEVGFAWPDEAAATLFGLPPAMTEAAAKG